MSEINSKDVVALRQKTSLGMMDCKRALSESNGDFDKAIEWLRKKGIAKGEARSGRAAGQGLIDSYIHPGGKVGVLIEISCETDFVARSEDFTRLTHNIAMQIAATAPIAVRREDIPLAAVEREMEIYREQLAGEKKPPDIIERIAKGKLEKFFQESCLTEQAFVKDSKITIKDLVLEAAGKLKENIQIRRFSRFTLGE
ncbi:MAG: translation elongation factor Ts [Calditrichota bacterium]